MPSTALLVVQFIRLDFHEALNAEMLVMERLYPLDYRAYEFERREIWLNIFSDELKVLHRAGFVHRDICRPSGIGGQYFDSVFPRCAVRWARLSLKSRSRRRRKR